MGNGNLYACPECGAEHFAWPSCGNRNCPKCGQDKVAKFLAKQQDSILPVNYFMITVTLPHEFHTLCRTHPRDVFGALFKTAAEAIQELAANPKHLGAKIGLFGTLQTWRRDGEYHPHIHFLAPGGGISPDGKYWLFPKNHDFLIPAKPLSILVRAKMRDALKKLNLYQLVPPAAWDKHWVSDCKDVGNGMSSFKYLAPYMQRGCISNNRILAYDGQSVTLEYTESRTQAKKLRTLTAVAFIRIYLQHVLPGGFQKTRYYGLLGSANKKTVRELRLLILSTRYSRVPPKEDFSLELPCCPKCLVPMVYRGRRSRAPPQLPQRGTASQTKGVAL